MRPDCLAQGTLLIPEQHSISFRNGILFRNEKRETTLKTENELGFDSNSTTNTHKDRQSATDFPHVSE